MQGYEITQSSAAYPLVFLMIQSSDHLSNATGLSPTVTISKNGGAFAAPSGAVSELGNGWYKVAGNATDTNTLGPILLNATATGADTTSMLFPCVAVNPQSTAYGLSLAKTTNITGFNDIAATAIVSGGAITTASGVAQASVANIGGVGLVVPGTGTIQFSNVVGTSVYSGADTSGTTTLLSRVTGAVALASQIPVNFTSATFANAGVFATAALANAPTGGSAPTVSQIAAGILSNPANLLVTDNTGRVTVGTNADKTGYSLASSGLDSVVTETGLNHRQAQALILAATTSIMTVPTGAGAVTGKNAAGTTRFTTTVDGIGNRTAVTYSPPA